MFEPLLINVYFIIKKTKKNNTNKVVYIQESDISAALRECSSITSSCLLGWGLNQNANTADALDGGDMLTL